MKSLEPTGPWNSASKCMPFFVSILGINRRAGMIDRKVGVRTKKNSCIRFIMSLVISGPLLPRIFWEGNYLEK